MSSTRDMTIVKLESARATLATVTLPQQAKKIADAAAAAEIYAKRQGLSEEVIGLAHALKIDALARLGELLRAMPKATGGDAQRTRFGKGTESPSPSTLADLGLDKKTSMIAQQLAALPAGTRAAIAARETTLTEATRQQRHEERSSLELPKGQYRVLYADPPWQYRDTRAGLGGDTQTTDRAESAAEQDYPTLSVKALCDLGVDALASTDAVLFCWATFPLLPDALTVVDAWGFEYKTAFVWHKPRGSFGHYHKANAELLLLATRGSCTPDVDTRESQVFAAPATEHSRKPDIARQMIDRLYPHGARIELFARRPASGDWKVWGNEP